MAVPGGRHTGAVDGRAHQPLPVAVGGAEPAHAPSLSVRADCGIRGESITDGAAATGVRSAHRWQLVWRAKWNSGRILCDVL